MEIPYGNNLFGGKERRQFRSLWPTSVFEENQVQPDYDERYDFNLIFSGNYFIEPPFVKAKGFLDFHPAFL